MPKYYTSGEFAKKAHVSIRTIRYYDQKKLLKPSTHTSGGARRYTDKDFAKLQQILLLKYLGFSLSDIREMTIGSGDEQLLLDSLQIQKKLVQERLKQIKNISQAIESTSEALKESQKVDWSKLLGLMHLTSHTQSLSTQYQNSTNISARIRLHRDYSTNPEGWFPWLFKHLNLKSGLRVLELGAGSGTLWSQNINEIPEDISIILSDISEGILADAKQEIGQHHQFKYKVFDAEKIPFEDNSFDVVIANHMLFYCNDINQALKEAKRVLKPGGLIYASTYSQKHMHEITDLVQNFNSEIVLSSTNLYERFGLKNGAQLLKQFFSEVECHKYQDAIELKNSTPLISYILSCHGNQNAILLDHYQEFKQYVDKEVKDDFSITKDVGFFVGKKK